MTLMMMGYVTQLPSDFGLRARLASVIGPWLSTTEQAALGGAAATYDSNFAAASDDMAGYQGDPISWWYRGCARDGTLGTSDGAYGGNYYDRIKVWYVAWIRTGSATYLTRARKQASAFLDFVCGSGYGENTDEAVRFSAPEGVYCYYLDMGNEGNTTEQNRALTAMGRMASIISGYHLNFSDTTHSDNRERAYSLKNLFWGSVVNAPSLQWVTSPSSYTQGDTNYYGSGSWAARLSTALDNLLSLQEASGRWGVYSKPFMNGLLHDVFYTLYEQATTQITPTQKANILAATQKSLDYQWTNQWNVDIGANTGAFDYSEDPADNPGVFWPDLNAMISAGYGWAAKKQSDAGQATIATTNKSRHDQVLAGGVSGVNLTLPKEFNQQYSTAFRGLKWANAF